METDRETQRESPAFLKYPTVELDRGVTEHDSWTYIVTRPWGCRPGEVAFRRRQKLTIAMTTQMSTVMKTTRFPGLRCMYELFDSMDLFLLANPILIGSLISTNDERGFCLVDSCGWRFWLAGCFSQWRLWLPLLWAKTELLKFSSQPQQKTFSFADSALVLGNSGLPTDLANKEFLGIVRSYAQCCPLQNFRTFKQNTFDTSKRIRPIFSQTEWTILDWISFHALRKQQIIHKHNSKTILFPQC